jgi:uncharacterized protein YbgA (DUF1722 family)
VYEMRKQVTVEDVRYFTLEQFGKIRESNEIKKLVHFHTINKYLLMMHSQSKLKILGNLVANKDKKPISIIFQEYEYNLNQILNCEVTIPSTANILNKIYSHFKKKLTSDEKKLFLRTIEDFKAKKIPLGEILNHVDNYVNKYENGYLQRQTFYLLYSDVENNF